MEGERWNSLSSTAKKISEACSRKDLNSLASSVREMKNRLRRPSIRKDLAKLEGRDNKLSENPDDEIEGECKCSECGAVIDGSSDPCIEGVLCVKCAYSQKTKKDDGEKKNDKEVSKDAKKEESKNRGLRKRGYV